MIRLRTLGTLDLRTSDDSEIRSVLAQSRRLALLVYLAVATPHGFHRRDRLLALFWPHHEASRGRRALNRAIYFLRRELEDDVLLSRGIEEIGLNRELFWCDAAEFEQAVESLRWREALTLYRGNILPGFFVSGASGFEEWLESQRARLRETASTAAWTVAEEEENAGNLAQAAQYARLGVELSPFREVGLRRLLALLDRAGDRASAGHVFQQFEQHIEAELELSPSPETRALIQAIRSRDRVNGFLDAALPATGMEQVLTAARPLSVISLGGTKHAARSSNWIRRGVVAAVIATSILTLALVGRPRPDPRRVHVAAFDTRSDRGMDQLGRSAANAIVHSLTSSGVVEVVTSGARDISAIPASSLSSFVTGTRSRAGTIISGAVYAEAGRVVVEARVNDARQRRVVWVVRSVSASPDSAERAIEELSRRVTGAAAALMAARFATWFPLATTPPTFAAFLQFEHGVDLQLRGFDRDAVEPLQAAVTLDPSFTWARLQLAQAYVNLFEEKIADSIIHGLNRDRALLLPLQRHWLDWMLSFKTEDWPGGYRALRAAAQLAPSRFLYNEAQWASYLNRPRETIRVLTRLGPNSPYTGGNDAYWGLLSMSYHSLGDHERELAVAREARRHADDPLNALSFQLRALARQGRVPEIRALLDTALTLAKEREPTVLQLMVGIARRSSPAQLMVVAARELRVHGHEDVAMEMVARALAWYRAQPEDGTRKDNRQFEIAEALYLSRDWSGAQKAFRALAEADTSNFILKGYLGTIAARLGDSVTARRTIAAFDMLRSTLPRPHAEAGYWQGKIAAILGDEERAIAWWKDSMGAQGRSGGVHTDFDFERMWHTKAFREFVRPKG